MKIKLEKKDSGYVHELFVVMTNTLKMPRERRRAFMRVGNKFYNAGPEIDLKPEEIRLTLELVATNIQAIEHSFKARTVMDLAQQHELTKRLNSFKETYEILKGGKKIVTA